jgi:hypothetical protein
MPFHAVRYRTNRVETRVHKAYTWNGTKKDKMFGIEKCGTPLISSANDRGHICMEQCDSNKIIFV